MNEDTKQIIWGMAFGMCYIIQEDNNGDAEMHADHVVAETERVFKEIAEAKENA